MSKVKIKKIKVPANGTNDKDLAEIFNNMLGTGGLNIPIAVTRFEKIKSLMNEITRIFTVMHDAPFMTMPAFAGHKIHIKTFLSRLESETEIFNKPEMLASQQWSWNWSIVSEEEKNNFAKNYEACKKIPIMASYRDSLNRLYPYKRFFINREQIQTHFVANISGVEWYPFTFLQLDIKEIFLMDCVTESIRKFFILLFHGFYDNVNQLIGELQSPDIDIDNFVDIIMTNIDVLKKKSELSHCDKAFQKIKNSVKLLKENFNSYYRDFLQAKDSTIIMQHFILDVSKDTNIDPQTTAQFRKIIAYYQKMADQHITDPTARALFNKATAIFAGVDASKPAEVEVLPCDAPASSCCAKTIDKI